MAYHAYVILSIMGARKINSGKETGIRLPEVSHCSSREEWEKICWRKIESSRNQKKILTLLTLKERKDLILRIATMERINSGKTYRKITEELWISRQTISSLKKAMRGDEYKSYWERSKTERKKRRNSSSPSLRKKVERREGRRVRTKYGDVYLPI